MVANYETKQKQSDSRPVPGKQDVIEMLLSWCELATEAGLEVEQLYATSKGRFSVRVAGVALVGERLVVGGDGGGHKRGG